MSVVHASRGALRPASEHLLSEVAIVCGLARRTLGPDDPVPWERVRRRLRTASATGSPGSSPASRTSTRGSGSPAASPSRTPPRDARTLPHRHREGQLHRQRARPRPRSRAGQLLLQTLRSHDQYNTTIYGLDDRYRGINERPAGRPRQPRATWPSSASPTASYVDLVSEWPDGTTGAPPRFRVVALPDRRAAAPPPTTRRPTCWCRWTAPPRPATPRPPSPW